jgi:hypothetical protein
MHSSGFLCGLVGVFSFLIPLSLLRVCSFLTLVLSLSLYLALRVTHILSTHSRLFLQSASGWRDRHPGAGVDPPLHRGWFHLRGHYHRDSGPPRGHLIEADAHRGVRHVHGHLSHVDRVAF